MTIEPPDQPYIILQMARRKLLDYKSRNLTGLTDYTNGEAKTILLDMMTLLLKYGVRDGLLIPLVDVLLYASKDPLFSREEPQIETIALLFRDLIALREIEGNQIETVAAFVKSLINNSITQVTLKEHEIIAEKITEPLYKVKAIVGDKVLELIALTASGAYRWSTDGNGTRFNLFSAEQYQHTVKMNEPRINTKIDPV